VAKNYFPFATGTGADSTAAEYTKMGYGMLSRPGVVIGYGNEMLPVVGSGTSITIKSGLFVGFGHAFENTADATLTLATPPGPGNRYTRIVARMDFAGETIDFGEVTGSSTAPGALTQSTNSIWEESLGVAIVTPAGNIATLWVALDRWATGLISRVGFLDDFAGPNTQVPKYGILGYGQQVDRYSYEKLWAVMPSQGDPTTNPATPPIWGRKHDGTDNIVVPDLRGRSTFGLDSMGGTDAGRITTAGANFVGMRLGSNTLDSGRVPLHMHKLLPHQPVGSGGREGTGLVNWVYERFGSYYLPFTADGGAGPHAAVVGLNDLQQMFGDYNFALDSDGDAHTELGPTGTAHWDVDGTLHDLQVPDSNMPESVITQKVLIIA
jgi:hypothetical protein